MKYGRDMCRTKDYAHLLLILLSLSVGHAPAKAQVDCNAPEAPPACEDMGLPGTDPGQACAGIGESRCNNFSWWLANFTSPWPDIVGNLKPGFPLNLALWYGPSAPGLPPPTTDPFASSLALVSSDMTHSGTPSPYPSRPTHNGMLDLVTGSPLYQETDFELPFGSATFRHTRTHADAITHRNATWGDVINYSVDDGSPFFRQSAFWDWNGQAWMMGEAPLLLIDASYKDLQPTPTLGQQACYLLLDAHHSIPFVKNAGSDTYQRSPLFDASLVHDANSDTYVVTLARGALRYTFEPHREDQWTVSVDCTSTVPSDCIPGTCEPTSYDPQVSECLVDAHKPPSQNGLGIPYYGLLRQIEDRNGNRVEIDYVNSVWTDCDAADTECCHECCQNCNEKGQIHSIRLYPAGAAEPAWTLVYTHRPFVAATAWISAGSPVDPARALPLTAPASNFHRWYQTQLHSIHVYRGALQQISGAPTLDVETFYGEPYDRTGWLYDPLGAIPPDPTRLQFSESNTRIRSFDEYDSIDAATLRGLPGNWEYCVQYMYQEPNCWWYAKADAEGSSQYSRALTWGNLTQFGLEAANLLKTTVKKQAEDGNVAHSHTMYLYSLSFFIPSDQGHNANLANEGTGLRAVFHNDKLEAIRTAQSTHSSNWSINEIFCAGPQLYVPGPNDPPYDPHDPWQNKELVAIHDQNGAIVHKPPRALADVFMRNEIYGDTNQNTISEIAALLDLDIASTELDVRGRRVFIDRRDGEKCFRVHRFRHFPTPLRCDGQPPITEMLILSDQNDQDVYHAPFRYFDPPESAGECATTLELVPWINEFYITVIDEIEPTAADEQYMEITQAGSLKSRRAVGMNVWGGILWERTWKCDAPGECDLASSEGYREEFEYDTDRALLIERRTKGWSVATEFAPDDGQTSGLVYFYEYQDDVVEPSGALIEKGELIATGIKQGSGETAPKKYTRRITHREDRRDLIASQTTYPDPGSEYGPETITWKYDFLPPADPDSARISQKSVERSLAPLGPTGAMLKPVEKWFYDEHGNETHHGVGLIEADDDPVIFFNHVTRYDDPNDVTHSRRTADIIDAPNDAQTPEGFERAAPSELPELNQITAYGYDDQFGLNKIVFPNGREQHIIYKIDPSDQSRLEQWTFKDVVPEGAGARVLSPVELMKMHGGRVESTTKVRIATLSSLPPTVPTNYEADIISVSTPQYDTNGRVTSVEADGSSGPSVSASRDYHASGQFSMQESPDGTRNRFTYDLFGRLRNIYQGTKDTHAFWETQGQSEPDNMLLVEKRYYNDGTYYAGGGVTAAGIKNIDRLVETRNYRNPPNNQYSEGDPEEPGYIPNNEDIVGWKTISEYDWRMRVVSTSQYSEEIDPPSGTPHVLKQTLVWVDNLDRVRFAAEYGEAVSLGTAVDPRELPNHASLPSAAQIIAAAPQPALLSLAETRYNARGQAEETRNYDVSDATGASYTATLSYYDHADRVIEVHAPNSPVQQILYDAKGRQRLTRWLARLSGGLVELSRTEFGYDFNDRVITTTRWERGPDVSESVGTLTPTTSVRSYVRTWYDEAGRVIATANLGTNGTQFTNNDPPNGWDDPELDAPLNSTPPLDWVPIASFPPDTLYTAYVYDDAGRQSEVIRSDHTVSKTEYDGLGRVVMTIENARDADPAKRQVTAYRFDDAGRLWMIAAVLPFHQGGALQYSDVSWTASDGSLQITELAYGATVVNSGGAAISEHNGWVRQMKFPNRTDGQPDSNRWLHFVYFSDGSLASRTAPGGVRFRYKYDEQRRLVSISADHPSWHNCPPLPDFAPQERIEEIQFEYDDEGKLVLATAWADNERTQLVSENQFAYDGFDDLTTEWQMVRAHVAVLTSPRIDYAWDFDPPPSATYPAGRNVNRLDSMTYPKRLNSPTRRTVDLIYGVGPDAQIDEALSRVSKLVESISGANCEYDYSGLQRRAAMRMGCGIHQTFVGGQGLSGLDMFGRTLDLRYTQGAGGATVHSYEYAYDSTGNRIHARVTQVSHVNDRSYAYGYDALQRLVSADLGELLNGTVPSPDRSVNWALDNLGNWNGASDAANTPGMTVQTGVVTATLDHDTKADNSLAGIERVVGGTATESVTVTDVRGNVAFDGTHYYQYDAWNRLVQVNEAGTLTVGETYSDFDSQGQYLPCPGANTPGPWIVRYVYDALGRLIEKQTPVIGGQSEIRREEYHYDGVRRIQELVRREATVIVVPEGEGGESNPEGEPGDPVPGELGLEEPVEIEPLDPLAPGEVVTALPAGWDQREYVWGPNYVDELAFQFDKNGKPLYSLLDGNFNVIAVVAGATIATASGNVPAGTVLEQYTWSPYGELVAKDELYGNPSNMPPRNRVGHQGLFFERYDGLNTDPPLTIGARGLYYNRNRWYDAANGRFLSQDMNATGTLALSQLAYHGERFETSLESVALLTLYGNGRNLFAYQGSNPASRLDPTGLVYDPFEDVDALIWELTGGRAAAAEHAMATIQHMAQQTGIAIIKGVLAGMFPPYGVYLAAEGAAKAIDDGIHNGWNWNNTAMLGLSLFGGVGSGLQGIQQLRQANSALMGMTSRLTQSYRQIGQRYSQMNSARSGFASHRLQVAQRLCFVANTPVLLEGGDFTPIDALQIGDDVASIPDPHTAKQLDIAVDFTNWHIYHLRVNASEASPISLSLLRPRGWFGVASAQIGAVIDVSLPEFNVTGPATIIRVDSCSCDFSHLVGGFVSGIIKRRAPETIELTLDVSSEPIGTTMAHPFWSIDRADWIPAGDLRIGEALFSLAGPAVVERVVHCRASEEVYNIEVYNDHTYFVSYANVLAHNTYVTPSRSVWRKFSNDHGKSPDVYHQRFESIKHEAGLRPNHKTKVEDETGDIICNEEWHEMFGLSIGNVLD